MKTSKTENAGASRERESIAWAIMVVCEAIDRGQDPYGILSLFSRSTLQQVCGVMWLGRDPEEFENLESACEHAKGMAGDIAPYMADKSPLVQYLRSGVKFLGVQNA